MKAHLILLALAAGFAGVSGCAGVGLIIANVAARLAHLEWWAEHAVGCWPDGCHFDK